MHQAAFAPSLLRHGEKHTDPGYSMPCPFNGARPGSERIIPCMQTAVPMSTLYIVATPIGNLEDVTLRALRILGSVEILACEDTRRTARLLQRHEIARPRVVFPYHEHNEQRSAERIGEYLDKGLDVALCSNAGYPGISDPGYRAVALAIERGHRIEVIPGASAVPAALIASGLPTSGYTFRGFAPRKSGQRRTFLEERKDFSDTLVFYESPYRLGRFLADALAVYGDRRAAICVELTKHFERIHRGWLRDLLDEFGEKKMKGELVVVIAGNHPKFIRSTPPGTECPDDGGQPSAP